MSPAERINLAARVYAAAMGGANTWEYATVAQREAFRVRVRELAPQVDVTQRRTRAELAAIEVLKWP